MIIQYPLSTEKYLKLIDAENKIVFVVDVKATKTQIKAEAEKLFGAKVTKINTIITPGAEKRAVVQFSAETPAIDIATKLGLM